MTAQPGGWEATATAPLDSTCLRDGDEIYRFPANRYTESGVPSLPTPAANASRRAVRATWTATGSTSPRPPLLPEAYGWDMIKPNIDCPGCKNSRRPFLRGLCNGCYRSPVIRDKHATRDKRFAVRYNAPWVVALRNKAVEDIRPGVVWKVALRVAEKFGGRVDPEDLVQEAYLHALRAANNLPKKFDPVTAPLWPAVKKFVILKMYKAARKMAGNTSHFRDGDADSCPVVVFDGVMRRAVSVSPTTR